MVVSLLAEATNWGLFSQGRFGHWVSRDELYEGNGSIFWTSLVAQLVKNLPATWEAWVGSLGWEDPLEKGMATHSSILAWRIPWRVEPSGLQSAGLQRAGHDWATKHSTAVLTLQDAFRVGGERKEWGFSGCCESVIHKLFSCIHF